MTGAATQLLVAVLLHTGCGDDGYRVLVHVPGGPERAARVEVALLRSCGEVADSADAAPAPLRLVAAAADAAAAPLGAVEPGSYGLHGRAWDAACALYAAGCDGVTVQAGTVGTLEVFLKEIPPRECEEDESCAGGICRPRDEDAGGERSCDDVYGDAPGYVLCGDDDGLCELNATLFDRSCADLCGDHGGSCFGSFANDTSEGGSPCDRSYEETCQATAWDQICVCGLP